MIRYLHRLLLIALFLAQTVASAQILKDMTIPSVLMLLLDGDVSIPEPPPPANFQTTVRLLADQDIVPATNELVTFGLPLSENTLTDLARIRITIDGVELPVCVQKTMTWWNSNTVRAVKIQLRNVNMIGGEVLLTITDAGRNTSEDFDCEAITNGWTSAGATKSNELYPRIFAIHDVAYLATSNIIPPYRPAPEIEDDFERYAVAQMDNWSGDLNYDASTKGNWLFDRSTAYFKNYITTGRVAFLKEAALSKQYYFQFVRNDGVDPRPAGGSGCWQKQGVACADGKYIAPQQAKLALALLGDDSQWDTELISKMAKQADLGGNQYHCSRPAPTDQNFGFTERACGLIGLAQLIGYEMTGDASLLATMDEIISYLKSVQQTEYSWDTNNMWVPKSGAFTHDIEVHEGVESVNSAPENHTDGQGFSPWMSENTADFLWQAYWVTGRPDIPEMLRRLGNAIDSYGFTSIYNFSTQEHELQSIFSGSPRANDCNLEQEETELLYFGSAFASSAQRGSNNWWRLATDNHNIEVVLPLAAAYHFETSAANKQRLKARIEKITSGWVNSDCAAVGNTLRLFNWQHRSNSIRTWDWVNQQ